MKSRYCPRNCKADEGITTVEKREGCLENEAESGYLSINVMHDLFRVEKENGKS